MARYWRLYGGWRSLTFSPYAQLSVSLGLVAIICSATTYDPSAITIAIVPSVLGFTVAALAIMLAFSSAPFFKHLTQEGDEESVFMKTVANFVHFIVVQVLALISAAICAAHPFVLFKTITSVVLFYAILTTLSTVIQLFQIATVFNASQDKS